MNRSAHAYNVVTRKPGGDANEREALHPCSFKTAAEGRMLTALSRSSWHRPAVPSAARWIMKTWLQAIAASAAILLVGCVSYPTSPDYGAYPGSYPNGDYSNGYPGNY